MIVKNLSNSEKSVKIVFRKNNKEVSLLAKSLVGLWVIEKKPSLKFRRVRSTYMSTRWTARPGGSRQTSKTTTSAFALWGKRSTYSWSMCCYLHTYCRTWSSRITSLPCKSSETTCSVGSLGCLRGRGLVVWGGVLIGRVGVVTQGFYSNRDAYVSTGGSLLTVGPGGPPGPFGPVGPNRPRSPWSPYSQHKMNNRWIIKFFVSFWGALIILETHTWSVLRGAMCNGDAHNKISMEGYGFFFRDCNIFKGQHFCLAGR